MKSHQRLDEIVAELEAVKTDALRDQRPEHDLRTAVKTSLRGNGLRFQALARALRIDHLLGVSGVAAYLDKIMVRAPEYLECVMDITAHSRQVHTFKCQLDAGDDSSGTQRVSTSSPSPEASGGAS